MDIKIRVATLDDVESIVGVHTAGEDLSGLSVRGQCSMKTWRMRWMRKRRGTSQ
ncbi:hypothetical protein [Thermococcus onnurineus]|uniref:hypothetical protein n=1 Tax=Thermococcus onnurineus TaxID=342948 RepID=UPI000322CC9C|nr:hypothetical protein [Thermococcus onnurineus]